MREERAERTYGGVINFVVGSAYPLNTDTDTGLRKEATYWLQAAAWQLLNSDRVPPPPPKPVEEKKKVGMLGKLTLTAYYFYVLLTTYYFYVLLTTY